MGTSVSMSELRNKNPRNLFDLSQKQTYSLAGGVLTPTQVLELNPGESVKYNLNQYMRARTLQTAAFARMTVHNDFFFVPNRVLWSQWDAFITQMPATDIYNSTFLTWAANPLGTTAGSVETTTNPNFAPLTTEKSIAGTVVYDSIPPLQLYSFLRYFMTGTRPTWPTRSNVSTAWTFNAVPSDPESDSHFTAKDSTGKSILLNMLKLCDMLGYGSFDDLLFGIYNGDYSAEEPYNRVDRYVNPFRLMSYYAICETYFRNDDYEAKYPSLFNLDRFTTVNASTGGSTTSITIQNAGQMLTNYSGISSNTSPFFEYNTQTNAPSTTLLFGMRTPLYQKDIISDIYPNQIYNRVRQRIFTTIGLTPSVNFRMNNGEANGVDDYGRNSNDSLLISGASSSNQVFALGSTAGSGSTSTSSVLGNSNDSLNGGDTTLETTGAANIGVYSLKNAEALQRMLEITRRASNSFAGQMSAHYGVDINYGDRPIGPIRIKSGAYNFDINEVVSTADSGDANSSLLGQIAGKGTAGGSLSGEFNAKEHGVFMALTYISPMPEYKSYCNPFNRKFDVTDYFQPEADRLGMQPLYAYNTPFSINKMTEMPSVAASYRGTYDDNQVLGWQPRYAEYKNNADVNHFGYGNTADALSSYVINKDTDISNSRYYVVGGTTMNVNPFSSVILNNIHVQPSTFDSIFAVNSNGGPGSDQFDVNQYCDLKVFRNMSTSGMPIFQI